MWFGVEISAAKDAGAVGSGSKMEQNFFAASRNSRLSEVAETCKAAKMTVKKRWETAFEWKEMAVEEERGMKGSVSANADFANLSRSAQQELFDQQPQDDTKREGEGEHRTTACKLYEQQQQQHNYVQTTRLNTGSPTNLLWLQKQERSKILTNDAFEMDP